MIEVEAVVLDDLLRDLRDSVRWVKMDVQGAELHALRGMRFLVESRKPLTIVSEFMPQALTEAGSAPEDLLSFLEDRGFRTYILREDGTLVPTTCERLASTHHQHGTYVNLVFERTAW